MGGGNIQTLLKQDVVDEIWLRIFPITLGPGKRLFAEGTFPATFSLQEAKTSPTGVIVAAYKRAGEVQQARSEKKKFNMDFKEVLFMA